MRVYIAGPLFSEAEKRFNLELDALLRKQGYDTFLPQRDGFEKAVLDRNMASEKANRQIFDKDVSEIRKCDILVMLLDGRVPDEGACVELGIAFALEKKCLGLKTDKRSLMNGEDNPLILGCFNWKVAHSLDQLAEMLQSITTAKRS